MGLVITEVTPADIPVGALTAGDVVQVNYDHVAGTTLPRDPDIEANGIATVVAPVKWRAGEWAFLRTDLGPFAVYRGETALVVARDVAS